MVLSWASETLLATRAHRREALGERALMGRMRVGALVSLPARLFMCVRDTRASRSAVCAKSVLFAGAVCGFARGPWRVRGALWLA